MKSGLTVPKWKLSFQTHSLIIMQVDDERMGQSQNFKDKDFCIYWTKTHAEIYITWIKFRTETAWFLTL